MTQAEINEFKQGVLYFWKEKEDPTRYVGWDEKLCRDLMPHFWHVWCQYQMTRTVMDIMANTSNEEE